MSAPKRQPVQDGQKSDMIIVCRQCGEFNLTPEQKAVFTCNNDKCGRCPVCGNIPRQIRRNIAESPILD